MINLFMVIFTILFIVLFFVILASEIKRIKLVIDNDVVCKQWRRFRYNKVALKQVKTISIKGTRDHVSYELCRNSDGRLVGTLSLHDSEHLITIGMHKAACYSGLRFHSELLSIVFNPDDLRQLMAVTNIPIYVTAAFVDDYGSSIGAMLPLNDPRIHICRK